MNGVCNGTPFTVGKISALSGDRTRAAISVLPALNPSYRVHSLKH